MSVTLDRVFPSASMEQCFGFMGCAGTIAANVFAAGGKAVSLRVGNWRPNPNASMRAAEPEVWVPGYDKEKDEVTLEAIAEVVPVPADAGEEVNPFSTPLWRLPGRDTRTAASIHEVLGNSILDIPRFGEADRSAIVAERKSIDPYYSIEKIVANFFGVVLVRRGCSIGINLRIGDPVSQVVTKMQINVEQTEDGEREETETISGQEEVVPVYLVFDKEESVKFKDVTSILSHESTYDPTWTLGDVLLGLHVNTNPHPSEGSAQ